MFKMLKYLLPLLFLALPILGSSQKRSHKSKEAYEIPDTIYRRLEQIDVYPRKGTKIDYRRYSLLIAKIKKVYPFAKDAAAELKVYNEKFEGIHSDKERRKYVKKVEKELFAKYEDKFKHLTVSEGRYLMLLIDRETGVTSYNVIDEVKGPFPAIFWQGVARIFGNNMKEHYDPVYKHYVIEQIVQMIDKGEL
jgi:hypothetical protein